jgi:hypothetical protein
MPELKPLKKLVGKAHDLREAHRARHRPTGYGFALSDSIDYLDATHWNALAANASIYLSPAYLRVLEKFSPENLRQRYALIFGAGNRPLAAIAAQSVSLSVSRVQKRDDPRRSVASRNACSSAAICSHGVNTESPSPRAWIKANSGLPSPKPSIACVARIDCRATQTS